MGKEPAEKFIYTSKRPIPAKHINAYLLDAPDAFVESRNKPLCSVPEIGIGNKPIDDGNYLFEKEEMEAFIAKEPASKEYFHPWYGSREFINQSPRYCLYLGNCPPDALRKMPECMKRVQAVREYRLSSPSAGTRKIADTPTRFHVTNMPKAYYICQTYNRLGCKVCPSHKIEARDLYNLVLADIQELAAQAIRDEETFYQRLAKKLSNKYHTDAASLHKEMNRLLDRNQEIDDTFLSLYTDKSKGILTEQRFLKLTIAMENEQKENNARISEIQAILRDSIDQEPCRERSMAGLFVRPPWVALTREFRVRVGCDKEYSRIAKVSITR